MSITGELRMYADSFGGPFEEERDKLLAIADRIDAEHKRRMGQCQTDTKRAALRYLRSVMEDYFKHSIKRRKQPIVNNEDRASK